MTLLRTFFVSIAVAMIGVIGYAFITSDQPGADAGPGGQPLLGGVFVRDQIAIDAVGTLNTDGYRTLVNLRPDG